MPNPFSAYSETINNNNMQKHGEQRVTPPYRLGFYKYLNALFLRSQRRAQA